MANRVVPRPSGLEISMWPPGASLSLLADFEERVGGCCSPRGETTIEGQGAAREALRLVRGEIHSRVDDVLRCGEPGQLNRPQLLNESRHLHDGRGNTPDTGVVV